MNRYAGKYILFISLLILCLTGCIGNLMGDNPSINKPLSTKIVLQTTISTQSKSTLQPSSTIDITNVPSIPTSITSTTIANQIESSATLPSINAKVTPIPTLRQKDAENQILNLLQNPQKCDLPCWWGLEPNITTIVEAHNYLQSFVELISKQNYKENYVNVTLDLPSSGFVINIYLYGKDRILDLIRIGGRSIKNHETSYDDLYFKQIFNNYTISTILSDFGKPQSILIRTYPAAPEGGNIPFRILLFYPQNGILIKYEGIDKKVGEIFQVCPQDTIIDIWLWNPSHTKSLVDIANKNLDFTLEELSGYKTIEEITNMDIDKFYNAFNKNSSTICLETDSNKWLP
jgi:hypothetical protein